MAYTPPSGTNLPFNFTGYGYTPPGSRSIPFNFAPFSSPIQVSSGNLQAAINVMQPYWETTYTYPKTCPKYVVGYGPGGVQIIRGRCTYGGIRDLQGLIEGFTRGQLGVDLPSSITPVSKTGQADLNTFLRINDYANLPAEVDTHQPKDLPTAVTGEKFKGSGDLDAFLGTHTPRDIQAYLGAHSPVDLPTSVVGELWHGTGDLGTEVGTHPPSNLPAAIGAHSAGNLGILLRAWKYGVTEDLTALTHGWQESPDLGSSIDTHGPANLIMKVRGWAREVPADLPGNIVGFELRDIQGIIDTHDPDTVRASIRAWQRQKVGDLSTHIGAWDEEFIPATIGAHMWSNLTGKVLPHPPPPLGALIRGWAREVTQDLPAPIHGWQEGDVAAAIGTHTAGNLGMLLRGWRYEAERNLPGLIHGWEQRDFPAIIRVHQTVNLTARMKGVVLEQPADLPAPIYGWQEGDLGVITKGGHSPGNLRAYLSMWQHENLDLPASIHGWQETNLGVVTEGGHSPRDVFASIRGLGQQYGDLTGILRGLGITDMPATVGVHQPANLIGKIKVSAKETADISAFVHSWMIQHLSAVLEGTHYPSDLSAYIDAEERRERNLAAVVRGWQTGNLGASIDRVFTRDLSAYLQSVVPANLPAYLKVWPESFLAARTYGWDVKDLGAYIKRIYNILLPAEINPVTDTSKDLPVIIDIHGEGYADLTAYARAYQHQSLTASLIVKYLGELPAYVFPVVPKNLKGILHGWDTIDLQGIITVADYPWNLTASIYPYGVFDNLAASLSPVRAVYQQGNLGVNVHPWEQRNFPASIFAANARNLSAYLEPHLQAGDLHASIRPKMIRLTTLIKIPTLQAYDLSSTINYLCFQTGFRDLRSLIYAKYKGDLPAYIKGRIPYNQPTDLGAKIGYSDSYMVEDMYKINVVVMPSKYFVQDVYRIKLSVLRSGDVLNAYIRATPRYRDLTVAVTGVDIEPYKFADLFKNRETVIHKTYAGIFETFESVEMAFKSAVKEYYYSSSGNKAWKAGSTDRWMLDVRSVLPADLAARLKRRLHRATTVYDFSRFASVDEAVKYAIAHVTEWPESNLGATIYNSSRYDQLSAVILSRYVRHTKTTMSASITPLQDTVVVNEDDGISTIKK